MRSLKKFAPTESRLIHIRLSGAVHRALRIKAAKGDITIQEFVATLIENAVQSEIEKKGGK